MMSRPRNRRPVRIGLDNALAGVRLRLDVLEAREVPGSILAWLPTPTAGLLDSPTDETPGASAAQVRLWEDDHGAAAAIVLDTFSQPTPPADAGGATIADAGPTADTVVFRSDPADPWFDGATTGSPLFVTSGPVVGSTLTNGVPDLPVFAAAALMPNVRTDAATVLPVNDTPAAIVGLGAGVVSSVTVDVNPPSAAPPAATTAAGNGFEARGVLVQFKAGVDVADRAAVRGRVQGTLNEEILTSPMAADGRGALDVIDLPAGASMPAALAALRANLAVEYAEPNYVLTNQATADDAKYADGSLWGMYGDDQPSPVGPDNPSGITTNAFGSQAEKAWANGHTGSNTVYVGIIDEGVDYRHPDLYRNIWINQGEIPAANATKIKSTPGWDVDNDGRISFADLNALTTKNKTTIADVDGNGVINGTDVLAKKAQGGWADNTDADGNGYRDDLVGWDFTGSGNNSTYDGTTDDHGTHVAGTIGAAGGNGIGVAGVNWDVRLIPAKFLGAGGGTTANAIKAVDYITNLKTTQGINIVATNNSWGGGGFSQGLLDAINRAGNAGILFIAAAGNSAANIDTASFYPAGYNAANEIAVAAIDSGGQLASFSNYGATKVSVGAPGVGVWSTLPNNSYGSYSGTSMATPHVTGAAALYAAANPKLPGETPVAYSGRIKQAILDAAAATPTNSLNNNGSPDSSTWKTSTGGRLNVSGF